MMRFEVQENVTKYLNYLSDAIVEGKDEMIKEAGLSIASMVYNSGHKEFRWNDEIGEVEMIYAGYRFDEAPDYSGALLSSALRENQRVLKSKQNESILDIYWTGMYADYSWWEFRHDKDTSKPPEVDYALFQETGSRVGIPHADSKKLKARNTGFFGKMINDDGTTMMVQAKVAEKYMRLLLQK